MAGAKETIPRLIKELRDIDERFARAKDDSERDDLWADWVAVLDSLSVDLEHIEFVAGALGCKNIAANKK